MRHPNLQIGMVFEIDRGTRVLTHSPTARHQRRHYRRYQPLSVCAVTSGLRRQCLRSTNSVCHLLSSCFYRVINAAQTLKILTCTLLLKRDLSNKARQAFFLLISGFKLLKSIENKKPA